MRRLFLSVVFTLTFIGAAAALNFPVLTGRVVDDAAIISESTHQSLEDMLTDYEQQSGNQIVVVTLRSLEGTSIEDYGYQLGRRWGIGQKEKDTGVLLIVAPSERKVRIEVGYGLEGTLTDAAGSEIIQGVILPAFRSGDIQRGIVDGVATIITDLGGTPSPEAPTVTPDRTNNYEATRIVICTAIATSIIALIFLADYIDRLRYGLYRNRYGAIKYSSWKQRKRLADKERQRAISIYKNYSPGKLETSVNNILNNLAHKQKGEINGLGEWFIHIAKEMLFLLLIAFVLVPPFRLFFGHGSGFSGGGGSFGGGGASGSW
jgi:uncharacterized protein